MSDARARAVERVVERGGRGGRVRGGRPGPVAAPPGRLGPERREGGLVVQVAVRDVVPARELFERRRFDAFRGDDARANRSMCLA